MLASYLRQSLMVDLARKSRYNRYQDFVGMSREIMKVLQSVLTETSQWGAAASVPFGKVSEEAAGRGEIYD